MKLHKINNYRLRRLCQKLMIGVVITGVCGTTAMVSNVSTAQTVQASTKTRKLSKKAKIYNKNGHHIGKKTLKKGKRVKIYGKKYIGGRKFYNIGKGRYVAASKFKVTSKKNTVKQPTAPVNNVNSTTNPTNGVQTSQPTVTKTESIKVRKDGYCNLTFDPSTKTLHIKGNSGDTLGEGSIKDWVNNANKYIGKKKLKSDAIKHISIDGNITLPENCDSMFAKLYNLQTIDGLDKVDAKDVTSMEQMFYGDKRLKTLDLSSWDTENAQYHMDKMFYGDKALKNLNLTGNFVAYAGGNEMFRGVNPDSIQGINAKFISNNS